MFLNLFLLFNAIFSIALIHDDARVDMATLKYEIPYKNVISHTEIHYVRPSFFKVTTNTGNTATGSHCDGKKIYIYSIRDGKYVNIRYIELSRLVGDKYSGARQRAFLMATGGLLTINDPDKSTIECRYFWDIGYKMRHHKDEMISTYKVRTYHAEDGKIELSFDSSDLFLVRQRITGKGDETSYSINLIRKEVNSIPRNEIPGLFTNLEDEPKVDLTDIIIKSARVP